MNTTDEVLDWIEAQGHKMAAQVDGLDDAQLRATPLPSGWSMLGLLGHVRDSTHFWLHHVLLGHPTELDEDDVWGGDPADVRGRRRGRVRGVVRRGRGRGRGLAADSVPAGGRRVRGAGTAEAPSSACCCAPLRRQRTRTPVR